MALNITSGKYRGMILKSPTDDSVRPTSSKTKAAVMNMLEGYFYDSLCLDLFSGSGAIGLEAVSRGARGAIFVEKNKAVFKLLNSNIKEMQKRGEAEGQDGFLLKAFNKDVKDSFWDLEKLAPFSFIWADPPYSEVPDFCDLFLEKITLLTCRGSVFAVESDHKGVNALLSVFNSSDIWGLLKEKKYGNSFVTVFERLR